MLKVRLFKTFFVLALIVGGSVFSTRGVSQANALQGCPTQKNHYKIGFANLASGIDFTTAVETSMKSAAQKAGNIDLVIANNNLDGATALNNAENFVAQGVDGVVEFQTDEKFGNVIMNLFQSQTVNIPVIAIDIRCQARRSSARTITKPDSWLARRLATTPIRTGAARSITSWR